MERFVIFNHRVSNFCKDNQCLIFQCPCKNNFGGDFCKECAQGFYNFPECKRIENFFEKENFLKNLSFQLVIVTKLDRLVILVTNNWGNAFANQIFQESTAKNAKTVIMIILNVLVSSFGAFKKKSIILYSLDCQCDNHGTEAEICEKNTGGTKQLIVVWKISK